MLKRSFTVSTRLLTLIFLAGNTLLLILIIISGSTNNYPVERFYWLEADTSGLANASDLTRWTFWGACGRIDGKNNCGSDLSPAYPISPVDNFDTTVDIPVKFVNDRNAFYYLSRFSFCFFWIALAFIGVSFIIYIFSWCSYDVSKVVLFLVSLGCLFNVTAVILQTAVTVLARDAFKNGGRSSSLGAPLLAISWASVFLSLCEFGVSFADTMHMFTMKKRSSDTDIYYGQIDGLTRTSTRNGRSGRGFFNFRRNQPANNTLPPIVEDQNGMSSNDTAPTTQNSQNHIDAEKKGINFFTIRNSNKTDEDSDST